MPNDVAEKPRIAVHIEIDRLAADEAEMAVPISFASERIVDDAWAGPVQLSLADGAVDLSRAHSRGIPVRTMHQRALPIARVVDVNKKGNKLHGTMRFSRGPEGAALYRDVADGIITDTSVGAAIFEVEEKEDFLLATRWEPREVSLVDIGADPNVGINRAQEPIPAAAAAPTRDNHMSDETPAVGVDTPHDSTKNAASIIALAEYAHKRAPELGIDRMGEDFAAFDKPFDEFKSKVWTMMSEHQSKKPAVAAAPPTEIGLTDAEAKNFSISRAIMAQLNGDWRKAGFELAASKAVIDRLGKRPSNGGFYVPLEVQRTMTAGSDAAGGFLVADEHRGDMFIDGLRNTSVALRMGVQVMSGLVGNVDIPKETSGATFYWLSEGEAVTTSDMAFGLVSMTPRTLAGAVPLTRRLLMQSTPDAENLVRSTLIEDAALTLDLAILEGTGIKQPLGVVNHPDINSVTISTDTTPTYAEVVDMESAVATDNALTGSLAYLTTSAVRGKMKTTVMDSGSGLFVCGPDNQVNGYPLYTTNSLTTSRLLFGNWRDIILGLWGVLEIKPDEAALASSGGLIVRVFQDADIAVRHGQSFAVGT